MILSHCFGTFAVSASASTDRLLLSLYACRADAQRWEGVLAQLSAEMGAGSAVLQALSVEGDRLQCFWRASSSQSLDQQYQTLISDRHNPRLEAKRLPREFGRLTRDDELFSPQERGLQQQFQQQLSQLGLGSFLGGILHLGENRYLTLALHRAIDQSADFSERQQDGLLTLLPHLGQAFDLGYQLHTATSTVHALRAHVDQWRCGLIVCDAHAQVQWHNRCAEPLLEGAAGLTCHGGILRALMPAQTQRLQQAIARQAQDGEPASYLALEQAGQRLHVALQTLGGAQVGWAPQVLVAVSSAETALRLPAAALATLFDLTEAEARLASGLVAGDTLEQYALRRGVSLGTVRYQLKQVLAKTGAARQSDLVRKVLCSVAAQVAVSQSDVPLSRMP